MQPDEKFIQTLETIQNKIVKELKSLIVKQTNISDKMLAIETYNIEKRMNELGYQDAIDEYIKSFDEAVISSKYVKKISLEFVDEIDLIQKNLGDYLLGEQKKFHSLLTMQIESGLLNGKSNKLIIESLNDVPLTTTQLKTVVNTSYANHTRNITKEAFKDDKEQKFIYVGGVIPTSSDACRNVVEAGKTYTMAQIEAGINEGGGLVDWGGRVPNFNCIHTWEPVDE